MPIRKRAGSRPPKPSAKSKKRAPRAQKATAHAIGSEDSSLREHLLYLLRGGGAHLDFEKAIAGLPTELRGAKPSGAAFQCLGSARAHADCAVGHSRIQPRSPSTPHPRGPMATGRRPMLHRAPRLGTEASRPSAQTGRRWSSLSPTPRRTCIPKSRTERVRRFCARRCSWRTITPIIWASSCCCADCWGRGRSKFAGWQVVPSEV